MPTVTTHDRLLADLGATFRPQRRWVEGRGVLLILGMFEQGQYCSGLALVDGLGARAARHLQNIYLLPCKTVRQFRRRVGLESRIAYLSRVPAVVLSISEGMQGSSLNAGNYSQARRNFADSWVYPTLQDLSGCLESIIPGPRDADLWFDADGIPFLRQDEKDAVEIESIRAKTITQLVREGFTAESAVEAVMNEDMTRLVHTGHPRPRSAAPPRLRPAPGDVRVAAAVRRP